MDIDGLVRLLAGIEDGSVRALAIETAEASPFSHEVLNANPYAFLDDAPLEERRARAVVMRRTLRTEAEAAGVLDVDVIEQVARVWPEPRDADELHDALLSLIVVPPFEDWSAWFEDLSRAGRAHLRGGLWVATERLDRVGNATEIVRGWMDCSGPVTAASLAVVTGLCRSDVDIALGRLEGEGQILQGRYRPGAPEVEWCHRRILARIHRATLGKLRREIEPLSPQQFYRFLCRWHHVTPGSQLHGTSGLLQIVRQLQGYEIPAAAWESQPEFPF
jgi:ATP-dependent Lhr-like helicase